MSGILIWAGRIVWRIFRRGDQFFEDWNGTVATPGHEARPGVLERMVSLEHQMRDVQYQVHLNGGRSMRDAVTRTEASVGDLHDKVEQLTTSVDELKARP